MSLQSIGRRCIRLADLNADYRDALYFANTLSTTTKLVANVGYDYLICQPKLSLVRVYVRQHGNFRQSHD